VPQTPTFVNGVNVWVYDINPLVVFTKLTFFSIINGSWYAPPYSVVELHFNRKYHLWQPQSRFILWLADEGN